MHLDKQHPTPIYVQLKKLLQNQIEQGQYLTHQQLPSERHLCQQYNLSRMTARRALQELVAEGYAYTRAGKGTFVKETISVEAGTGISPLKAVGSIKFEGIHSQYRQKLLAPLQSFDCFGLDQALHEILAVHPLETIACKLFPEIIRHLEQQWQKGYINLPVHNYAIITLRSYLISMMNAATMVQAGPKIILSCAPGDVHELGLLSLAVIMRRRGIQVVYLGPNITMQDFRQTVTKARPRLICISAATTSAANSLIDFCQQHAGSFSTDPMAQSSAPLFTFGGVAFSQNKVDTALVPGIFLGATLDQAVTTVEKLLTRSYKDEV